MGRVLDYVNRHTRTVFANLLQTRDLLDATTVTCVTPGAHIRGHAATLRERPNPLDRCGSRSITNMSVHKLFSAEIVITVSCSPRWSALKAWPIRNKDQLSNYSDRTGFSRA